MSRDIPRAASTTVPCPECCGRGKVHTMPERDRRGWNQFEVMRSRCRGYGVLLAGGGR